MNTQGRTVWPPARRAALAAGISLFALVFAVGLGISPVTAGDVYAFERGHSAVLFSWNHLGISRQTGRFTEYTGTLELDAEKPEASRLDVLIKASSLATGYDALDRELKTSDYFAAAQHPTITFRSTEVKKTGEKTAQVTGELTILGVAKPVVLDVSLNFIGPHPLGDINPAYAGRDAAGFSAKTRIKRSDWGMERATPLVSDEIEISIESEFLKRN